MKCWNCDQDIDHVVFVVTEQNSYSYSGDGSACWEYKGSGDCDIDRAVCPLCGEELQGLDTFEAVDAAMQGKPE